MYLGSSRNATLCIDFSSYVRIGCSEWERKTLQRLKITVNIHFSFICSDRLIDTLDYSFLRKRLASFIENSEFQLIETLSEKLVNITMSLYNRIAWCSVCVNKVNQNVICKIEKSREQFNVEMLELKN